PDPRPGGRQDRALGRARAGPRAGEDGLRAARGGVVEVTQATLTSTPFDLERLAAAIDDGPLAAARRSALDAFRVRGLPGPRDEAWRFTSLAPVARGRFEPAPRPD